MMKLFLLVIGACALLAMAKDETSTPAVFAGPRITLTCKSSQADFELETKRRLAVYNSRAAFCKGQKASVAVIDRCLKEEYNEWRRLEKQVEDLMVQCSALEPDAPESCETKVRDYNERLQTWRDQRTVELAQCDSIKAKDARQTCQDACVERFNLLRPRKPVCASKDGEQCALATAAYQQALSQWEKDSQKELDSCKGKKDQADCTDRAVVRWRPKKPVAPACSKEAVCERDVREYRRQVRSLRLQRVASMRACRGQSSSRAQAACSRDVNKHFRNRLELLKKPKCANADAPAPGIREKCPATPGVWDCKAQRCSDAKDSKKVLSSRCCSHATRAKCARTLLIKGTDRCDKLKSRVDRARCRKEVRKEADEITSKRRCPSVEQFQERLRTLRRQLERDAAKCDKKDDKCRKAAHERFNQQEKLVSRDPCFRKPDRCDEDKREYRRQVRALNLARKQALLLCKEDAKCRENKRAEFTLKRRQLQKPVCDETEVRVGKSCERQNRRYQQRLNEVERQRKTAVKECHKLADFAKRRDCQKLVLEKMDKLRKLVKKPLCKENARSFDCRARLSEYARTLRRYHTERRQAIKACKGDKKCRANALSESATKRRKLRRPACARAPHRSTKCEESKKEYRRRIREHNHKRHAAHKACKKDVKCRASVTAQFKAARAKIPLPACPVRVHKELRSLRKCGALKTRKERQACRKDVLSRKVDTPSKSGRRVRALTKCHRFKDRARRSACEKAARERFPHARKGVFRNKLNECRKAENFHKCRAAAVEKQLKGCRKGACRQRVRREARRWLQDQYRERVNRCKTSECRKKEDSDFFRRLHQEQRDARLAHCKAIKDADRSAECVEGVRHRHRTALGVRQCRVEHKRGKARRECVHKAHLLACHEFEDQTVKQRCIDRRTALDRLRTARRDCRAKNAKGSPALRKCLEQARRDLPNLRRSCSGRFGKSLLRCHRRNVREARAAATRRARRALRRCKNDLKCRSIKQTDLLETRALYRRYLRSITRCGKPQGLRKAGNAEECVKQARSLFKKRRAAVRLVRRCDRINIAAGRKLCRDEGQARLLKAHCAIKDTKCAAELVTLLRSEEEQRATRIGNHKRRAACRKLSSKSGRKVCLRDVRKEIRSRNRVERAKRACLTIKDEKARHACVRRAVGGPDDVPARQVVTKARAGTTGAVFPLWALAPIIGGAVVLAVLVIVAIAYRRVKSRRSQGDRVALASTVDAV